jgi:diguanylate cyclase (GGDEF)-like protein
VGGEEFLAALPDTDLEHAVTAANRLRKVVEEAELKDADNLFELAASDMLNNGPLKVTVSVGVATCDESTKNIDIVIDHADRAMYSVKCTGRNQINIWDNGAN